MSTRLSVPRSSQLYNVDLLQWRREQLGLTFTGISAMIPLRRATVIDVFQGRASSESAHKVALALGLNWALVCDVALPEDFYYLAVRYFVPEGRQLIAPTSETSNSP